jgi:hypothetical protein
MSTTPRRKTSSEKQWRTVLRFNNVKVPQSKIARAYAKWRREQNIPDRCDNPDCQFHRGALEWNGKRLKLILDHSEGNRYDNSPQSLRYLCPNCDSQLLTRGGGNRGRVVDLTADGYTLMNRDGSKIVAATGRAAGSSSARGASATAGSTIPPSPNNAIDDGTSRAPLRAPARARHRGR